MIFFCLHSLPYSIHFTTYIYSSSMHIFTTLSIQYFEPVWISFAFLYPLNCIWTKFNQIETQMNMDEEMLMLLFWLVCSWRVTPAKQKQFCAHWTWLIIKTVPRFTPVQFCYRLVWSADLHCWDSLWIYANTRIVTWISQGERKKNSNSIE